MLEIINSYDNTISFNKFDKELPYVLPFTGQLTDTSYQKLLDNIYPNFKKSCVDSVTKLKNEISKNNYKIKILEESHIGRIASSIIEDVRIAANKLTVKPKSINIMTEYESINIKYCTNKSIFHCLYRENPSYYEHQGGKRQSYNNNWEPYTLIICIDSDIPNNSEEGSIQLHVPSRASLLTSNVLKNNKMVKSHIFKDSCIPYHFLIFPTGISRTDLPIKSNFYKLELELVLWFNIPIKFTQMSRHKIMTDEYAENCTCMLCSIQFRTKLLVEKLQNILNITPNILKIIVEYYIQQRSLCTGSSNCICYLCIFYS